MILMWIRSVLDWIQDTAKWFYRKMKIALAKIILIITVTVVLLWISVFIYGSFYYIYIPSVSHTRCVHFQFSVCGSSSVMCSFPTANVSFGKEGKEQMLMRGQSYSVLLDLELPESPVNKDVGMFMVHIQFYDRTGAGITTAARSALLHYQSSLLETLLTFTLLPLLLAGSLEQKQTLSIELLPYFLDDLYKPAVGAMIEVQSQRIQIYSAVLRIHAHFSGLRYLMFNWPVLSAVCGIGTNMFFLSLLVILSCFHWSTSDKSETGVTLPLEERRARVKAALDRERSLQEKELLDDTKPTSESGVPTAQHSVESIGFSTEISDMDTETVDEDLIPNKGMSLLESPVSELQLRRRPSHVPASP